MALVKKRQPIAYEGLRSIIDVSFGGADFEPIENTGEVAYEAGEAQSETLYTFDGSVTVVHAASRAGARSAAPTRSS